MTKLQALEWYMEQVADTFRHWFPENAERENEGYISNWGKNDAISWSWKRFLCDYNSILYEIYKNQDDKNQISFNDLETR
jgi:hypothetical protein